MRILSLSLILVVGCATVDRPRESTVTRVWPEPPDAPRIAYVQSLSQPADAGLQPTGMRYFLRRVFGADLRREKLAKPLGIALDENDNLCITDTGAAAVIYFDRANRKWQRWEQIGKARLNVPVAIAKRQGIFYVADSGLAQVLVFDETGKPRLPITARLERPAGLAIAGDRLYVVDSQRHCVVVFDLAGHYQFEFGKRGAGAGELNFPTHITLDAAGHVYVTDALNGRVQVFDTAGKYQTTIGQAGDSPGYFSRPKGVAVDSFGHVYVVDANFDNFQIFNWSGQLLLTVGEAGAEAGEFWLPNGIAISRQNEIFITDSYNHRVQIFHYVGQP